MRDYNTYLFDWDGCLARTLDTWMKTYQEVYARNGSELTLNEVISTSWGNCEIGPKNVGFSNYNEIWEEIASEVAEKSKQVPLYEYAKELLVSLKDRGKNIAIVTSSQRKIVEPALNFHGIDEIISTLVTEEDVSEPKPNPEIIEIALSRMGATKEDSIIIGDTAKDINAGNAAGIDSILVLHEDNRKYYDFEKLKESNATYSLPDLKSIAILE